MYSVITAKEWSAEAPRFGIPFGLERALRAGSGRPHHQAGHLDPFLGRQKRPTWNCASFTRERTIARVQAAERDPALPLQ
jgi:hypothetical protein